MRAQDALIQAKSYINKALQGLGALKGAPCTIKSSEPIENGTRITFEWTGNNGVKETSHIDIPNGTGSSETPVKNNIQFCEELPENTVGISEDTLFVLKSDDLYNGSVTHKKGLWMFNKETNQFQEVALDSLNVHIKYFDETGTVSYYKDDFCLYRKRVGNRESLGFYICNKPTSAPWKDEDWNTVDATEFECLTAEDINNRLNGLTTEQQAYLNTLIHDDSVSTTHTWSSSKMYTEFQSVKGQINGRANIPNPPALAGNYVLQAEVDETGTASYSWVKL